MKKGYVLLLSLLSDREFHSGEELAKALDVSRAAIWKLIKQLGHYGLSINAVHGKGYQLDHHIELFSESEIRNHLSTAVSKYCRDIEILFKTSSTNTYLLEKLDGQEAHGHVVLAEYQSDGRGRRGNTWVSPLASGIYLSISWRFNLNASVLNTLSLYIGLALARALTSLNITGIKLKWPNDILINEKKLGGVLIDMRGEVAGPVDVIIGIGINYYLAENIMTGINQRVTDICSNTTGVLSRNQLTDILLSYFFEILINFDSCKKSVLIDEWLKYFCYYGKPGQLISQHEIIEGIIEGVDNQGCLLMSKGGVVTPYTSGELSLRLKQ